MCCRRRTRTHFDPFAFEKDGLGPSEVKRTASSRGLSWMESISCLVSPIPDHAFFKQSVFEGEIGHGFLRRRGIRHAGRARRRASTHLSLAKALSRGDDVVFAGLEFACRRRRSFKEVGGED
jgi:hypothetical protein